MLASVFIESKQTSKKILKMNQQQKKKPTTTIPVYSQINSNTI